VIKLKVNTPSAVIIDNVLTAAVR